MAHLLPSPSVSWLHPTVGYQWAFISVFRHRIVAPLKSHSPCSLPLSDCARVIFFARGNATFITVFNWVLVLIEVFHSRPNGFDFLLRCSQNSVCRETSMCLEQLRSGISMQRLFLHKRRALGQGKYEIRIVLYALQD